MDDDSKAVIIFGLLVLAALGFAVYVYWDIVLTIAIVILSAMASGVAIFYGARYWLSVEYVSPVAKYVKAEKYDRALELADRIKPHRFAILEINEERQLRAAHGKLIDKNELLAIDIARWKEQIKSDMRSSGTIDSRLRASRENPQSEEFKKRLLRELARLHGMKIE